MLQVVNVYLKITSDGGIWN